VTDVDLLITDTTIVTMDAERRIITHAALAVTGATITAIGKSADLTAMYEARTTIDGRRFVITPGLINTHVHTTGEPLTRGLTLDGLDFQTLIYNWLVPAHMAHTEADERLATQCAALEMLRSGTTTFLEAGTIRFLDSVADGLTEIGIRARIGQWAWDFDPETQTHPAAATDAAIALLESEVARYPARNAERIAAWPILVGHMTCSDRLWQAAKSIADIHHLGVAGHMSPVALDPDWFLARYGHRPIEHFAEAGVLGPNIMFTHAVHLNDSEVALLAQARANVSHCATTAMRGGYGASAIGRFPEMLAQGVNITVGTDGNNDSNFHDMMRATHLVAGLHKDARQDTSLFTAEQAFTCATLNGARALQMEQQIGSLEPGKKADFVAHDTNRSEWRPLFNVMNQLVWSADGRGVHSVWVDGKRVVENYRCTTIDEDRLLADAQTAGEALVARSGLKIQSVWPVV
jgi:cytosine/adenosine deaminase-related metal-dependent hydrolase